MTISPGKKTLWILGVPLLFFLLLSILILFSNRLKNLDTVKEHILAGFLLSTDGRLEYERLDFFLLPRPHVTIYKGSLAIAENIRATFPSLSIYPKILPLIKGKVEIGRLQAQAPHIKIKLMASQIPGLNPGNAQGFAFAALNKSITDSLVTMAGKVTGLNLAINKAQLDLSEENKLVFQFQDIDTQVSISRNKVKIDLKCTSNLWRSFSFNGWLDSKDLKGNGRINLDKLSLRDITDFLFPQAKLRISDSEINLKVLLNSVQPGIVHADIEGSLPYLTLFTENKEVALKGQEFQGTWHLDQTETTISLAGFRLLQPQIDISGKFFINQTTPLASLELEGREVNVGSVREAALALLGDNHTFRKIFQILKGGEVPLVRFKSAGSDINQLGHLENIFMEGTIKEGEIFAPKADLDLEKVTGEVVISQGILEGKNLEAHFGNSHGDDGTIKVGLIGHDAPFHLDIMIQADLVQLPPILHRLVKNDNFLKEVDLVKITKGNARGRLILGESRQSLKTNIEVSNVNLNSNYQRFPYFIEIGGGGFSFTENNVFLHSLNGRFGNSILSQFSAHFNWAKEPNLEITSMNSRIFLDQIYPWLLSFDRWKGVLKDFPSGTGIVSFTDATFKGPLFNSDAWRFKLTGVMENCTFIWNFLPDKLMVASSAFDSTEEAFSFKDAQIALLDSVLTASGVIKGNLRGFGGLDLDLQGNMGEQAVLWLSNSTQLPSELNIRPPLLVSQAHWVWNKNAQAVVTASFSLPEGPIVLLDLIKTPGAIKVKNLSIEDKESRAALTFNIARNELNLIFTGQLTKTTLDKLLAKNQYLSGWVSGDIQIDILSDKPMNSGIKGQIRGEGFHYPGKSTLPLTIKQVSLNAIDNRLEVASADISLGNYHLTLKGHGVLAKEGLVLDMKIITEGISWEQVKDLLGKKYEDNSLFHNIKLWGLPLRGIIMVNSDYFQYDNLTWKPFHANFSPGPEELTIELTEARLCGISTPGNLKLSVGQLQLDIKPFTKDENLAASLFCLWNKSDLMDGTYHFKGDIVAKGKKEELTKILHGNLELTAKNGRIYRFGILAKIFAVLNVTEILRGKLPDLVKEGFGYDSINGEGKIQDGKLMIKNIVIEGSSMNIIGEGVIDLIEKKIDMKVVVAPLKTVDSVIKHIPIVGGILEGRLVSIPIHVTGDLEDPTVIPLSPAAVGSELLGILKRTLMLPFTLFQPLLPEPEKEE